MAVEGRFAATVLRPVLHGPVGIREAFSFRPPDDDRLLNRLQALTAKIQNRTDTLPDRDQKKDSLAATAALVKSYIGQKNRCAICELPMSIVPVLLEPPIGGDGSKDVKEMATIQDCGDWCLDIDPRQPYKLAHSHCIARVEARLIAGESDLRLEEQDWLHDIQRRLGDILNQTKPNALNYLQTPNVPVEGNSKVGGDMVKDDDKLGGNLVRGAFVRLAAIQKALVGILQEANESPNSDSSRWMDTGKRQLEKRCHKVACCGQWNPAAVMRPRRPLKPGQIDSNDYFDCFCPFYKRNRPNNPYADSASLSIPPTQPPKSEPSLTGESMQSPNEGVLHRRAVAYAIYEQHRRLLPLYVASNLKVLLPNAAPSGAEESQWAYQECKCRVCGFNMCLEQQDLHWDLHRGFWCWMHARCNGNPWASLIVPVSPGPTIEYKRAYALRHQTEKLFDDTLQQILSHDSALTLSDQGLELISDMSEPLRARVANLAEQSHIQMRFCRNHVLKEVWQSWLQELDDADPEAAAAAIEALKNDRLDPRPQSSKPNSENHRPMWRRRKKRPTNSQPPQTTNELGQTLASIS